MNRLRHLITITILCLIAISCTLSFSNSSQSGEPTVDDVATIVAGTIAAKQATQDQEPSGDESTAPGNDILPQPVYYTNLVNGTEQIWRLEMDVGTKTQITFENESVASFDVSLQDGSIVYVVNNQIYWVDKLGKGRKLLFDGGPADDSDEYLIYRRIGNVLWSPGGLEFAYLHGGLNFFHTDTGENRIALEAQVREFGDDLLILDQTFSPSLWSPDGSLLLIDISYYEGGSQAVYDPATNELSPFRGDGIICCHSSWLVDGSAVLVASPWMGMIDAGLWRYDAKTGEQTRLLSSNTNRNNINYAGWPIEMPNGDLQFFFHHAEQIIDGDTPLVMVRSASDGVSGRHDLRPEEFIITQALWTPDGSAALLVLPPQTSPPAASRRGQLVFGKTDGSPIIMLVDQVIKMKWGMPQR